MGSVIHGIGKALGGILKGIEEFASSPFGKLLIGIGLTALTGGLAAPLMGSLGGLGALGGMGSLGSIFSGVASNFLGPFSSMLSGSGLGTVAGFLGNATGSGDLLNMVSGLVDSQNKTDQSNQQQGAAEIAHQNLLQMVASTAAQFV